MTRAGRASWPSDIFLGICRPFNAIQNHAKAREYNIISKEKSSVHSRSLRVGSHLQVVSSRRFSLRYSPTYCLIKASMEDEYSNSSDACLGPELWKLAKHLRQYRAVSASQFIEREKRNGKTSDKVQNNVDSDVARKVIGTNTVSNDDSNIKINYDEQEVSGRCEKRQVFTHPETIPVSGRVSRNSGDSDNVQSVHGGRERESFRGGNAISSLESDAKGDPISNVGVPSSSETAATIQRKTGKATNAAVLISLFRTTDGNLHVWLTKRASKLSSHSGEIALPGGKRDKEDIDDSATALREAMEEIGLLPSEVEVVTQLSPFLSKHLLTVTPVVGILRNGATFIPQPNLDEVELVFSAPLAMFLESDGHRCEDLEWLGMPYRVHHFRYFVDGREHDIWGLTAAILIRTASVVFDNSPSFGEFHPNAPSYDAVLSDLAGRHLIHI